MRVTSQEIREKMELVAAYVFGRRLRRERRYRDPLDPLDVSDKHLLACYRFPRHEILALCEELEPQISRPTLLTLFISLVTASHALSIAFVVTASPPSNFFSTRRRLLFFTSVIIISNSESLKFGRLAFFCGGCSAISYE